MEPEKRDLFYHGGQVEPRQRERLLGQRGCVVWITGLSGSGKSTLARACEAELHRAGRLVYVLDGDNIRHGLNADLGFAPADREENIRRVGEVAALFADAGLITLVAFISPYRRDRERVRRRLGEGRFLEVYLEAPLEVCEQRDPKGLYRKARAGEIEDFTGVDAPYEPPPAPELVLPTARLDLAECTARLVGCLESAGCLEGPASSGGEKE